MTTVPRNSFRHYSEKMNTGTQNLEYVPLLKEETTSIFIFKLIPPFIEKILPNRNISWKYWKCDREAFHTFRTSLKSKFKSYFIKFWWSNNFKMLWICCKIKMFLMNFSSHTPDYFTTPKYDKDWNFRKIISKLWKSFDVILKERFDIRSGENWKF